MKNFALIGVAGFVALRHLEAIFRVGGRLLCALDTSDSVGVLDKFFPDAEFFTNDLEFFCHILRLQNTPDAIDFVSICSPNFLHFSHIFFALNAGAHVICEKPLVLNPVQILELIALSEQKNRKIFCVLQLRLHENFFALQNFVREKLAADPKKILRAKICYVTPRGAWYRHSWKNDARKSGGLATNIGVHLFDILGELFGDFLEIFLHEKTDDTVFGEIFFACAHVHFLLSIDKNLTNDNSPRRIFEIDNFRVDFENAPLLHQKIYENALKNEGFSPKTAARAIKITHEISKFPEIFPLDPKISQNFTKSFE